MRRVFPCTASLLVLLASALPAQSIEGTWQGTLPAPDHARVAVKLAKAEDGLLHGIFYQFDQSPPMGALTTASFTAPELSFTQINVGISYQGKLSDDARSIVGTWTQNKVAYPLTLTLATPETMWRRSAPVLPVAMPATADPAFEVATIKPSPPEAKGYSYSLRTRAFAAKTRTVEELIEFAYQMRARQVSGGPAWMHETSFDIAAKPDAEGQPSVDQYRLMVKKLLASRFHLEIQTVKRSFPVYALVRDEKAPVLAHSDPEFDAGSLYVKNLPGGETEFHYVGESMPMFADTLMTAIPERQIVDETGWTGHFEFSILLATSAVEGNQALTPGNDMGDAFRHALSSLGLKLVPKVEPLDVIVVTHLEQPSAN